MQLDTNLTLINDEEDFSRNMCGRLDFRYFDATTLKNDKKLNMLSVVMHEI